MNRYEAIANLLDQLAEEFRELAREHVLPGPLPKLIDPETCEHDHGREEVFLEPWNEAAHTRVLNSTCSRCHQPIFAIQYNRLNEILKWSLSKCTNCHEPIYKCRCKMPRNQI